MRLSGLQKEVLSLYRSCLRESRKKPAATRPHFESFARSEFDKHINTDKRDFFAIEFLLRKGRRQLEMYSSPGIKDKGSPNRRPKIAYQSSVQPNDKLSHRAAEAVFRTPLPQHLIRERQRQRRISRKKNGVRVSRRLPSRGTGEYTGGDRQPSLTQIPEFTEDHPYWGTLRQSQIYNLNPGTLSAAEDRYPRDDGAHVQATTDDKLPSQNLRNTSQKARGRRQRGMSVAARSRGVAREKRFGLADPIVWDAINRSLDQQRRLSTLVMPEEAAMASIQQSEIPSRTSSQRKALNRFTRQLEKYADAAGAAGYPLILTPTESESKVSYHTVQPLLPYRKEFQAAGLAVTSAEQSRGSPLKPRGSRELINHLPRNVMAPMQMTGELDGQGSAESEQLSSSSGSYVVFTAADHPITSLPALKSKSTQKSPPKGKKGIIPWLRKKTPARKFRGNQPEQQQIRPPARECRVQRQVQTIYSQNAWDRRKSRALKDPLVRVPGPTLTRYSQKPTQFSSDAFTPSPRALSSIEARQDGHGPHQRPANSQAGTEFGARQSAVHTGLRKRDAAAARPPRPETIEEEKESSPSHPDQTKVQIYPLPTPKVTPVSSAGVNQESQGVSPRTTPSTVPSLPYPARYASARPSSLERALDEVSQQLEQMEREADKSAQLRSRPQTAVDEMGVIELYSSHQSDLTPSRPPRLNEEVIFVNRKMPLVESSKSKVKKSLPSPPKPTRVPPSPPRKRSLPTPPKEKALPTAPQTETILNDLDVFFDYDDADLNDRDVIKGLQVAIHAAADNVYDAFIRQRTGLRIRRFLADLMAVGEAELEDSADQRAKERAQQAQKARMDTRL
ncbi:hypothetical protein F5Y13DRAFT_194024 [Hypoxylon sp. FL1857]|nr:hypothetical protein F5Y13DRAFT_194024 [Hypoxylon sp. FL1857]